MAGAGAAAEVPHLPGARVLIVEARFYAHINDLLVAGRRSGPRDGGRGGGAHDRPGCAGDSAGVAMALESGRFDAFVALGCVIRGETTHYELVAGESCRGLMDLGTRAGAAIGNGILTVENEPQALVRADPAAEDKGGGAARAALNLLAWRNALRGSQ